MEVAKQRLGARARDVRWLAADITQAPLPAVRYDAESLHSEFGARFRLVVHATELHQTPSGTTQQFLYRFCKVE